MSCAWSRRSFRCPVLVLTALQRSHTTHDTRYTSHVTRHTSHVTLHTSHFTRHTSHVTRHAPRPQSPSPAAICNVVQVHQQLPHTTGIDALDLTHSSHNQRKRLLHQLTGVTTAECYKKCV
jgi:hypothetical protein